MHHSKGCLVAPCTARCISCLPHHRTPASRPPGAGGQHALGLPELQRRYAHLPPNALQQLLSQLLERRRGEAPQPAARGLTSLLEPAALGVLGGGPPPPPPPAWLRPGAALPSQVHRLLLRRQAGLGRPAGAQPPEEFGRALQHQLTVRGHRYAVYCLAYDRSGRYVVTGSDDRLVKVGAGRGAAAAAAAAVLLLPLPAAAAAAAAAAVLLLSCRRCCSPLLLLLLLPLPLLKPCLLLWFVPVRERSLRHRTQCRQPAPHYSALASSPSNPHCHPAATTADLVDAHGAAAGLVPRPRRGNHRPGGFVRQQPSSLQLHGRNHPRVAAGGGGPGGCWVGGLGLPLKGGCCRRGVGRCQAAAPEQRQGAGMAGAAQGLHGTWRCAISVCLPCCVLLLKPAAAPPCPACRAARAGRGCRCRCWWGMPALQLSWTSTPPCLMRCCPPRSTAPAASGGRGTAPRRPSCCEWTPCALAWRPRARHGARCAEY